MSHYILQDYDKEVLDRYLISHGNSDLNKIQYLIGGSPFTINREARIAESYDEGSLKLLAAMHEKERKVIKLD